MKPRDLIVYSLVFLALVVFTADVVNFQLTGNHIFGRSETEVSRPEPVSCTDQPAPTRPATSDIQLKALSEYEAACSSSFLSDMMIFTNMPISQDNAVMYADKMTGRLKEFQAQNIKPIVIAEPDSDWGLVDFQEFGRGDYDAWILTYFQRLKANGVTDDMLGTWIPFPEPQQPFWNNNGNPDDFAYGINRYLGALRSVFPAGKTGILLDSQVSEENQSSQLLAYTRLIDNNLVDVAGLQGFPWHPSSADDEREPVISADVFAPASLLQDVAESLGTKEVLFNVGTYRHRKIDNGGDLSISLEERQSTLDSILKETRYLKERGYDITVNVFAQNKYDMKEGVDWSYWNKGESAKSEQTPIFTQFVRDLKKDGMKISLFDSVE